jgi:2-oxo-4-hydroxy-4-carboxy--5-ureidoimidazoline (OHCU) decarboxylase
MWVKKFKFPFIILNVLDKKKTIGDKYIQTLM